MSLAELVLSLALQRASSATPRALLGLDASAPMITVARSTATAEGIAIEWWEANAVELPFPRRPSMLYSVNRACSSSPIDRPRFGRCAECLSRAGG